MNNRLLILLLLLGSPLAYSQPLTPESNPEPAYAFSAEDLDGNTHRLSDYRGRVVVINFWATWCPPCVKELPSLQRAADELAGDDIEVIGIAMGETVESVEKFLAEKPVEFTMLIDDNMVLGPQFGVQGLPTTLIIDANGRVRYRVLGDKEWDDPEILDQIRALAGPRLESA